MPETDLIDSIVTKLRSKVGGHRMGYDAMYKSFEAEPAHIKGPKLAKAFRTEVERLRAFMEVSVDLSALLRIYAKEDTRRAKALAKAIDQLESQQHSPKCGLFAYTHAPKCTCGAVKGNTEG